MESTFTRVEYFSSPYTSRNYRQFQKYQLHVCVCVLNTVAFKLCFSGLSHSPVHTDIHTLMAETIINGAICSLGAVTIHTYTHTAMVGTI